jgi:hypothetical protein
MRIAFVIQRLLSFLAPCRRRSQRCAVRDSRFDPAAGYPSPLAPPATLAQDHDPGQRLGRMSTEDATVRRGSLHLVIGQQDFQALVPHMSGMEARAVPNHPG